MDELEEWDDGSPVAVKGSWKGIPVTIKDCKRNYKLPAHRRFRRAIKQLIVGGGKLRHRPLTAWDLW